MTFPNESSSSVFIRRKGIVTRLLIYSISPALSLRSAPLLFISAIGLATRGMMASPIFRQVLFTYVFYVSANTKFMAANDSPCRVESKSSKEYTVEEVGYPKGGIR